MDLTPSWVMVGGWGTEGGPAPGRNSRGSLNGLCRKGEREEGEREREEGGKEEGERGGTIEYSYLPR